MRKIKIEKNEIVSCFEEIRLKVEISKFSSDLLPPSKICIFIPNKL